ncbi:MAG: hypothetical protein BVN29_18445 [Nitrospira sp. ST-bin5]|nr:MAG: hypothetical protein BVN29_18445 [Nitrospira sp. ST-bin5]
MGVARAIGDQILPKLSATIVGILVGGKPAEVGERELLFFDLPRRLAVVNRNGERGWPRRS